MSIARDMCTYWEHEYDWRARERGLNAFPQFTEEIDDLTVHFVHVRSQNPGAIPIVLTHGWPGDTSDSPPPAATGARVSARVSAFSSRTG